jgi:hypothetical protein
LTPLCSLPSIETQRLIKNPAGPAKTGDVVRTPESSVTRTIVLKGCAVGQHLVERRLSVTGAPLDAATVAEAFQRTVHSYGDGVPLPTVDDEVRLTWSELDGRGVRKFVVLHDAWVPDSDELTATAKLKRKAIASSTPTRSAACTSTDPCLE